MTATAEAPETVTLKDRADVDPKDCWDLSSLYADDAAFEVDIEAAEVKLKELAAFKGRLGEGASALLAFLDADTATDRVLSKLHNYASRKSDQDTANSHYANLKDQIGALITRAGEAASWFSTELLALPDEALSGYLTADALAPYRFALEKLVRKKPYTLGEGEERILALSSELARAPSHIFGQLLNADLRFGFVEDENGKKVEVTHGSYGPMLEKRDREVRKRFFHTYYKGFEDHAYTLAAALQSSLKRDAFYAKARGYKSSRHAALFGNNIPEAVYDGLLTAVHNKLPALYRYYNLRKELLGLPEIHFYDIFVPVVPELSVVTPFETGVDQVLASLAPLGAEYTGALSKGLKGSWVDRFENRGKRSGAYSAGCYDSEPFILLNYKEENLGHVYTLTHEAGHSMHSLNSRKAQTPQSANYTIFVAEVASTFNETLLTQHLLSQTTDPRMRAFIINREIDAIRGTLFRQSMFAEFEHLAHERIENEQPMSLDAIKELYHGILERYYGPDFTLDPCLDLECLRIPHFYYNFYVYQYATGISAAIALADKVLNGGEAELAAYHGFLKSGGSKFPIDLLKDAGVDMSTPAPVEAALGYFDKRVTELEQLMREITAS